MTRRPRTQEQATKRIHEIEAKMEAIEAKRMELVGDHSPEAIAEFNRLGRDYDHYGEEHMELLSLRGLLPTQAQWEYEEDMRLQEQIANDPYGGDDFMAYNMMGDCW